MRGWSNTDFGERFRRRAFHRRSRTHFRGILHHQAARHRYGTVDQSAHNRIAWRPAVGEPQHGTGHDFSVHAARRGDSVLTRGRLTRWRQTTVAHKVPPGFDRHGRYLKGEKPGAAGVL